MQNELILFDFPGGDYEDGMIARKGKRPFPIPWPARRIGIAINGQVVVMTREEALETAAEIRSMAQDG